MDKATKKALLRACRPDEPIPPNDPRHFDFDAFELRGKPWRRAIAEVIEFADEPTAQGVTGLRGSGKTTELALVGRDLQGRYGIAMVDASRWLRDDSPISPKSVLLASILSFHLEESPEGESCSWRAYSAYRVRDFLHGHLPLTSSNESASHFNAIVPLDDLFVENLAARLDDMPALRAEVSAILREVADLGQKYSEPIVLLLDGIEHRATGYLQATEEQASYCRAQWLNTFLACARDLCAPFHVVYTVPPFTIRRAAGFRAAMGQDLKVLGTPAVWSRLAVGHPVAVNPVGLTAMREALFLRLPRPCFVDPRHADWMILHSGGDMRDLLRMATYCVYMCEDGGRITADIARAAVERLRQIYREGLERRQKELLADIHRLGHFPLSPETADDFDCLLLTRAILRYHQPCVHYIAHPLLWTVIGADPITWKQHIPK